MSRANPRPWDIGFVTSDLNVYFPHLDALSLLFLAGSQQETLSRQQEVGRPVGASQDLINWVGEWHGSYNISRVVSTML